MAIPKGNARIAVDAFTGEVLVARGSLSRWHPASLTKMMTLYMLFDALERGKTRLNAPIKISSRAARQPPSRLGIGRGGRILVRDAIQALAVKSANDIAVAVAEHLAGSEVQFARQMNRMAKRLGMSRTNFRNASGLHHSRQVTTARDMAILAVALMRDYPQYYRYFGQKRFRFGKRTYRNSNRMLGVYDGMDGIKTGYIFKAGFNLAASVERDGRRVVAVVMGANSSGQRTRIMSAVLKQAFAKLDRSRRARITAPLPVRLKKLPPLPRPRPDERRPARVIVTADFDVPIPPAAPVELAEGSDSGDYRYSVQVGAFRQADEATRMLMAVMADLPPGLGDPEFAVMRGGRLYRARLVGYANEADAAKTCLWLRRRNTDCLIVVAAD